MNNYQKLQNIYQHEEVNRHCINMDVAYGIICSIASCELDLAQWMPMLFVNETVSFSQENIATNFAQITLDIYQESFTHFQENTPLPLDTSKWLNSEEEVGEAASNFSNGYLQVLMMIERDFPEGGEQANLQQTSLLLLNKLANHTTNDETLISLFLQLPENSEIIAILPTLLSAYGHHCISAITHNE